MKTNEKKGKKSLSQLLRSYGEPIFQFPGQKEINVKFQPIDLLLKKKISTTVSQNIFLKI